MREENYSVWSGIFRDSQVPLQGAEYSAVVVDKESLHPRGWRRVSCKAGDLYSSKEVGKVGNKMLRNLHLIIIKNYPDRW